MKPLDRFLQAQEEPNRSCFLALREVILACNEAVSETIKYGMPCFCYKDKPLCYLWKDKKTSEPYVLFVDGLTLEQNKLIKGNRARMKTYSVNPNEDIDVEELNSILRLALQMRE